MSLGSTFSFFLSNKKWRKVRFLIDEKWRRHVSQRRKPRTPEKGNPAQSSAPAVRTKQWLYEADVPLPSVVFNESTQSYSEDRLVDENHLVTRLVYHTFEVESAAQLTNETIHRSIFDANDSLIPEASFIRVGYKAPAKLTLEPEKVLAGLSANLYGNTAMAGGNYAHWMIDGLPRLFLILQHYSLEEIDYFIVPPLTQEFHRASLDAFGIGAEKIVEMHALECIGFERLICTTPPRGFRSNTCPGWLIDNYRKTLLPQSASLSNTKRKIYISRRDSSSRQLINEEEVIAALELRGFESVELSNYNFHDKMVLFSESECIIGLAGAGMSNLMFCAPNTRVLELQPSSNVIYLYATICGYLNLNYHPIVFESGSNMTRLNKYYGNLFFDIKLLDNALDE